jgi:hypothetical protein
MGHWVTLFGRTRDAQRQRVWTLLLIGDSHRFARDVVVPNVRGIFTMGTGLQKQLNGAMLGSLLASLICANGIVSAAPEVEPNDAQAQAQVLVITDTGASVSSMMGTASGAETTELDIFAFDAGADETPSIMVVTDGSWDPMLVLYDSNGDILDINDRAVSMNPGSRSLEDPRIDWHKLVDGGKILRRGVADAPLC